MSSQQNRLSNAAETRTLKGLDFMIPKMWFGSCDTHSIELQNLRQFFENWKFNGIFLDLLSSFALSVSSKYFCISILGMTKYEILVYAFGGLVLDGFEVEFCK